MPSIKLDNHGSVISPLPSHDGTKDHLKKEPKHTRTTHHVPKTCLSPVGKTQGNDSACRFLCSAPNDCWCAMLVNNIKRGKTYWSEARPCTQRRDEMQGKDWRAKIRREECRGLFGLQTSLPVLWRMAVQLIMEGDSTTKDKSERTFFVHRDKEAWHIRRQEKRKKCSREMKHLLSINFAPRLERMEARDNC